MRHSCRDHVLAKTCLQAALGLAVLSAVLHWVLPLADTIAPGAAAGVPSWLTAGYFSERLLGVTLLLTALCALAAGIFAMRARARRTRPQ